MPDGRTDRPTGPRVTKTWGGGGVLIETRPYGPVWRSVCPTCPRFRSRIGLTARGSQRRMAHRVAQDWLTVVGRPAVPTRWATSADLQPSTRP